ncbi:MAG: phospholipase D family protein [Treponema sp.]|nr:phospholipase D family protein [Treponema sp.]
MINPKKERLIYSDILTPPYGYELEKAITTTYSLDVAALVSCMIPLAFSADVSNKLFKNKVSTFTALRNLSKKMIVFCDPGQIKELKGLNKDFAILLENMIIPVNLPKDKSEDYPAFHPKMWLLQFVDEEGNHKYRFITLSRNISYDRCYDVTIAMDSSDNHQKTRRTKPIIEFLEYLENQINTKEYSRLNIQKGLVEQLRNELIDERICFSLADYRYEDDDFDIYPLFDEAHRKVLKNDLFRTKKSDEKAKYDDMFVMSPFLTEGILNEIKGSVKKDKRIKLITRQTALNDLDSGLNKYYDVYVLNDAIVLGTEFSQDDTDEALEDEDKTDELHDIHAKMYLAQQQKHSDLYLGSINATASAFNRNIELMVRIGTKKKYLNVEDFFNEMNSEDNQLFEKVEIQTKHNDEKVKEKEIELLVKILTHIPASADVKKNDDNYSIKIRFDSIPDIPVNTNVTISPFAINDMQAISNVITYEDLSLSSISEFYKLKVEYTESDETICLERIIKIPTQNIPYEERDSAIVNGLIKDKDTFAEYVTLLLSRDCLATQSDLESFRESNSKWNISNAQTPLYEMLLKASVENPEAVKLLESDLKLITNKEIVSDEFRNMYKQFLEAIGDK